MVTLSSKIQEKTLTKLKSFDPNEVLRLLKYMVRVEDSKANLEFVRESLIKVGTRSIEPEYSY